MALIRAAWPQPRLRQSCPRPSARWSNPWDSTIAEWDSSVEGPRIDYTLYPDICGHGLGTAGPRADGGSWPAPRRSARHDTNPDKVRCVLCGVLVSSADRLLLPQNMEMEMSKEVNQRTRRDSICVLCKEEIPKQKSLFVTYEGHPAFEQDCPLCGWFIIQAPAVKIMDVAVKDAAHRREDIVEHFRKVIELEVGGEPVFITIDDAQDYCYGMFRKNWKYFEKHRRKLAKDHHGKYVILFNENVYAIEDSEWSAYQRAIDDDLKKGRFYIRRCIYKQEEVPAIIRRARVNAL